MPEWMAVLAGLVIGVVLIGGILWVCFGLERGPRRGKSRLAEPSGDWDRGPSVGGGPDP